MQTVSELNDQMEALLDIDNRELAISPQFLYTDLAEILGFEILDFNIEATWKFKNVRCNVSGVIENFQVLPGDDWYIAVKNKVDGKPVLSGKELAPIFNTSINCDDFENLNTLWIELVQDEVVTGIIAIIDLSDIVF